MFIGRRYGFARLIRSVFKASNITWKHIISELVNFAFWRRSLNCISCCITSGTAGTPTIVIWIKDKVTIPSSALFICISHEFINTFSESIKTTQVLMFSTECLLNFFSNQCHIGCSSLVLYDTTFILFALSNIIFQAIS